MAPNDGLTHYNHAGIDALVQMLNGHYDGLTQHEQAARDQDKKLMEVWGGQGHGGYSRAFANMMTSLNEIQQVLAKGTSRVIEAQLGMRQTDKQIADMFEPL
ncbi:WXG100 family type VII secretion target [Nocardia sp. X0981]